MIRNAVVFSIPSGWPFSSQETGELLGRRAFLPCSGLQPSAEGFVPPREEAQLCHFVHGRLLMCHQVEEKLLPAQVVDDAVEARAQAIHEREGYWPGRRHRKELKEEAVAELLPQAFSRRRRSLVWVYPPAGLLVVEASSVGKAEAVLSCMRAALENLPVQPLDTERDPGVVLASWLLDGEALVPFSLGSDCKLKSPVGDKPSVSYSRIDIACDEVQQHVRDGKWPEHVGLEFDGQLSLVVTGGLEMKRLSLLGVVEENEALHAAEQFDADFLLIAAAVEMAAVALLISCGGLRKREPDLLSEGGAQ